jgi:hypothetical protein
MDDFGKRHQKKALEKSDLSVIASSAIDLHHRNSCRMAVFARNAAPKDFCLWNAQQVIDQDICIEDHDRRHSRSRSILTQAVESVMSNALIPAS